MSRQRAPWSLSVALYSALIAAVCGTARGAESTGTIGLTPTPAKTALSSLAGATTIPVAPSILIGMPEMTPGPPPVRPNLRATPEPAGPVTYRGLIPKTAKVAVPALKAYGKGELKIQGDCMVHFAGDGLLWVDKGTSVVLVGATTYTKTAQRDGWAFEKFRGTTRLSGSPLNVEIKGDQLMITADGRGKVTMSGEGGMFQVLQPGGVLVSGVWNPQGVTQEFARLGTAAPAQGAPGQGEKYDIGGSGLLPAIPPKAKVVTPKPLPSSSGEAAPGGAPPPEAPTAPTTATQAAK